MPSRNRCIKQIYATCQLNNRKPLQNRSQRRIKMSIWFKGKERHLQAEVNSKQYRGTKRFYKAQCEVINE